MYHCLIDTGALVMGFTNDEVAKVLLKMLPEELFDSSHGFGFRVQPHPAQVSNVEFIQNRLCAHSRTRSILMLNIDPAAPTGDRSLLL